MDNKLKTIFKVEINKNKTKMMTINTWKQNLINLKIGKEKMNEVKEFKYTFKACMYLEMRLRFLKTYICNIALYGCET